MNGSHHKWTPCWSLRDSWTRPPPQITKWGWDLHLGCLVPVTPSAAALRCLCSHFAQWGHSWHLMTVSLLCLPSPHARRNWVREDFAPQWPQQSQYTFISHLLPALAPEPTHGQLIWALTSDACRALTATGTDLEVSAVLFTPQTQSLPPRCSQTMRLHQTESPLCASPVLSKSTPGNPSSFPTQIVMSNTQPLEF